MYLIAGLVCHSSAGRMRTWDSGYDHGRQDSLANYDTKAYQDVKCPVVWVA